MGTTYTIRSMKSDLSIDVDFFIEQLKKTWFNVKIYQTDSEAHPRLQWDFDTDEGGNISGHLYQAGASFRVFENKSIGIFARWVRSIIPPEYDLVLYENDLSHHPIELHDAITYEEIEAGFHVPFDISKYK